MRLALAVLVVLSSGALAQPAKPKYLGPKVACKMFKTWQEAQTYMLAWKATRLDRDRDGIACESLKGAPKRR